MFSFASRVRSVRLAFTLIAFGALGTGCAQPSRFSSTPAVSPAEAVAITSTSSRPLVRAGAAVRSSRYTITRADFAGVPAHNAWEIVFRVRPEFLQPSTRRSVSAFSTDPVVYIDAMKTGSLSTLREIPVESVMQITYLTPVEALLYYGPTHSAGAIVVRTSR